MSLEFMGFHVLRLSLYTLVSHPETLKLVN